MTAPLAPLARDVGCRRDMMWATRLHPSITPDDFLAVLEQHDFAPAPGGIPGRLHVYDHAGSGNRIVFVPHTGRLQIRLDALTRHEDRSDVARAVYDVVLRAAAAAMPAGPLPGGRDAEDDADAGTDADTDTDKGGASSVGADPDEDGATTASCL